MVEATTKTITPITHILRCPKMSERRPPRAKSADERNEVAVDHPLHARRGQVELALNVGHRDRHDRLVDEGHGDREDHRGQDPVATLHPVPCHRPLPEVVLGADYSGTSRHHWVRRSGAFLDSRFVIAAAATLFKPAHGISASCSSSPSWSGPASRSARLSTGVPVTTHADRGSQFVVRVGVGRWRLVAPSLLARAVPAAQIEPVALAAWLGLGLPVVRGRTAHLVLPHPGHLLHVLRADEQ